ncbi:hypothetical protein CRG98_035996 [Punica granatum]|nr:hypothetical protein CRG98_035996 [Punica granatum]
MRGSWRWDSCEDVPLNKSFESASGDEVARPSEGKADDLNESGDNGISKDDVYENVAVIVVSSRRIIKGPDTEEAKKKSLWVKEYLEEETAASPNPNPNPNPRIMRSSAAPKPVDEDLYKIPPELLFSKPKKKITGLCFSCLLPACDF